VRLRDNQKRFKKYYFSSIYVYIGCSFKFPVKVGVEKSIVNAPRITDHLFKSYRHLYFNTSGAFTIDSSTPTLTGNLNEDPIYLHSTRSKLKMNCTSKIINIFVYF
jgi:hypothetical protein